MCRRSEVMSGQLLARRRPRFLHDDSQCHSVLDRRAPAVIVFRCEVRVVMGVRVSASVRMRYFDANLAEARFNLVNFAMQLEACDGMEPQSDRRRLGENYLRNRVA